jgi:hypothetical protein
MTASSTETPRSTPPNTYLPLINRRAPTNAMHRLLRRRSAVRTFAVTAMSLIHQARPVELLFGAGFAGDFLPGTRSAAHANAEALGYTANGRMLRAKRASAVNPRRDDLVCHASATARKAGALARTARCTPQYECGRGGSCVCVAKHSRDRAQWARLLSAQVIAREGCSHRCLPRMPLGHCCEDQHERERNYQNAEQRPGTPPLSPEVCNKVAPPAQRAGKTKVRLITPKAQSVLEFPILAVTGAIAIGRRCNRTRRRRSRLSRAAKHAVLELLVRPGNTFPSVRRVSGKPVRSGPRQAVRGVGRW